MRRGEHIDIDLIESVATPAVEYALSRRVKYADVRIQHEEGIGFAASGGEVEGGGSVSLTGIGVRVLAGGAFGFCSADNCLSKPKMQQVVDRAIKLANKSSQGTISPAQMAPTKTIRTRVVCEGSDSVLKEDFTVEDIMESTRDYDKQVRSMGDEIQTSGLSFTVGKFIETFASSEGSLITQAFGGFLGTIYVVATSSGITEYYPYDFGRLGDYKTFLQNELPILFKRIAKSACQLTKSRTIHETKKMQTVIMDPQFTALWVHETIGHPLEADRVLGGKGDPQNAPWTFAALGKKVTTESLSVVDDPSVKTPAWCAYDSEGVEARRKSLIFNGTVKGCIHNRETAAAFQIEPNGGARSPSYRFIPMPRMSNTYIESGDWNLDEIIEDTKEGVYVIGGLTPLVDSRAYEWKISAKESFIVDKGETKEMLRNVIVSGTTPDFLTSIDALGRDLQISVTPDCGKGSPIQLLPVGNGGPSIRGKAYVAGAESRNGEM
jgi:TldD protein